MTQAVQHKWVYGLESIFRGFLGDRFKRSLMLLFEAGRFDVATASPRNRAPGAVDQNRSRSIKWAAKQEKFQPLELCFFLTSTFIELIGS